MAVKFFGQYLVEKNIVSRDQLVKAIDLQEQKNLKLGEMAVSMGYITERDIDKAHNEQLSKDMKLGDLLVAMGILTLNQLNEVITRQKNSHLYIGEALIQVGAFTATDLENHLADFKADQAEYVASGIEVPPGLENSAIWEMAVDITYKMVTRVLDLQYRAGKCSIVDSIAPSYMIAAMDFSGDLNARYMIGVSEELQKSVAKSILHEESVDSEPQEVLEDTVMEFVNVVCGNIAAKASQMGKIMDINPPVTIRPSGKVIPVAESDKAILFPIHIGDGDIMELLIVIK